MHIIVVPRFDQMPRRVAETRLQERLARARLKQRRQPYWRSISEGRHIGYYKGLRRTSWIARWYSRSRAPTSTKRSEAQTTSSRQTEQAFSTGRGRRTSSGMVRQCLWRDESRETVHSQRCSRRLSFGFHRQISLEKTRHTIERHIRARSGQAACVRVDDWGAKQRLQSELAARRSVYRVNPARGVAKLRPERWRQCSARYGEREPHLYAA